MEKAKIIGTAPLLVVNDIVKTAEYYRDVLGFTIDGYWLDPPVYAIVRRNGFQVHFGTSDGDATQTNHSIRKGTPDFVIWVPEIDAFSDEVKENGAEIIQEITQRPYGRELIVRDLDGHSILVVD